MKQKCYYFLLELKSAAKRMLLLFLILVISITLLFSALLFYNRALENEKEASVITLAVVLPESDNVFKNIIGLANSLVSLRSFCRLESCKGEDVLLEGLADGTYNMGIVIPDSFYEMANSMQEASFILYAPRQMSLSEKKLVSLLEAVERVMIVTEGGIVGMYSGMKVYDFPMSVGQMENDLTNIYVSSFLNRDSCFLEEFVSPYGEYSFLEYYLSSGFIILVLILSLSLIGLYDRYKLSFEKLYFRSSLEHIMCSMIKIMAMALCFFAYFSVLLFLADTICYKIGSSFIKLNGSAYAATLLLAFSLASLFHLLGVVFLNTGEGGIVIMLLIILLMPIISGGIVPISYLPQNISKISANLPFGMYHKLMLDAVFGEIDYLIVTRLLCMSIIMMLIGTFIYSKRIEKNV